MPGMPNHRGCSRGLPIRPGTHNLRPAENYRRIKDELGIKRALPLSYFGIWSRRPDSNRRPRAYQAITQSCDPSKRDETDKRRAWEPSHIGGWGGSLNPLAVSRLADNPNSTARLKNSMDKWLPQIRGFASGTRTRNTRLASGGSLTVSNHPFGLER